MKKLLIILLLAFGFLFSACSPTKEQRQGASIDTDELYNPDLKLKVKQVYSWLNLMPGPPEKNKARFHITGELEVLKSVKYELDFIRLHVVNIYQNDEFIYSIVPEVRVADDLSSTDSKYLIFSTVSGLHIEQKLDTEKPIDVKLIFKEGSDLYPYTVKDLKIEKAH